MTKPPQFPFTPTGKARLPSEDALKLVHALLKGQLAIHYNSGVTGPELHEWVEVRASAAKPATSATLGDYTLAFGIKQWDVKELWWVSTPSGKVWDVDREADAPLATWSKEALHPLTKLLVKHTTERKVVVTPYWKVEFDQGGKRSPIGSMRNHGHGGPKSIPFPEELDFFPAEFSSEERAREAAEKFERYLADQAAKGQTQKNREKK